MNLRVFFIAFACFTTLLFTACKKLDRALETDLTLDQIGNSFINVQNTLNGVYSELREGFSEIGNEAMFISSTDDAEHTLETNSIQLFNQGSWNAINNPADIWGVSYRAIRKANFFLEIAIPEKVNLDAFLSNPTTYQQKFVEVKRWGYEAKFLRSFFYFELIKRYGGVPLITTTQNEDAITTTQRSSFATCVKFITDECDSAAANLPLTYPTGDLGRITKGAALALKSRVLLYAASDLFNTPSWANGYSKPELIAMPTGSDRNAQWKAAADAAKTLIDLPGTGYALAGSYRNLFTGFTSPEIIFTRRNGASNTFEINNFPIGFDRGKSGTTPTQDLVDAYEVRTGPATTEPFDWNNPAHSATPYANRDPRLGFTVVTNGSSFSTVAGITRTVETWTGGKDAKPIPNATKTGYYLRKYVNESVNLTLNTTAAHSWIYFRLGEVFLNYAEALNEYAPGHPDIKIFVDRVRNRSGVAMPGITLGTQDEVRQKIRNERRIELAFEDHRPWDVRRWMIAPTVLNASIRGIEVTNVAGNFTYSPGIVETRSFLPKMYLFPINQTELSIATGLVQNPLW